MSAKYTFNSRTEFIAYVRINFKKYDASVIAQIFNALQGEFNADKIIAHNICVAMQNNVPVYMISEYVKEGV